jgi:hypothetical protein
MSKPRAHEIARVGGAAKAAGGRRRQAAVGKPTAKRHGGGRRAHRPRPSRHDRRRRDPQPHRPHRLGPRPAEDSRAGGGGDDVVDGDPREVGDVEESRDETRAAQAQGGARGDDRGDSQARPHGRERREKRARHAARGDQPEGLLPRQRRGQARSDLERRRDDVGAREDQEQVEGRLSPLLRRHRANLDGLHRRPRYSCRTEPWPSH